MDTSYLEKQVSTIINKLHELFDEIGVPSHERDSRESELFAALSDTLHNQLKLVTNEKHKLAEECEKFATTIKQMHISLDGKDAAIGLDDELQITYPLQPCLQVLKDKHKTISKLHRERYEQVKKLALAIDSYASHLEPSFMKLELPPLTNNANVPSTFDLSHTYFTALDTEFTRVYEEYQRRLAAVQQLASDVINLWAELGTPQAQTDTRIVELWREAPEQLGLHSDDMGQLKGKRDRLVEEKKGREKRLRDMGAQIEALWERLCIPEEEQKGFFARNRGCGMRVLNEYEDELGRLNELKKQNLGLFVEEARIQLQALWDELYFSEDEMLLFAPAFSDVYSDALLAAHEAEIARLEALRGQRLPILSLIDKHKTLVKDRDDLAASSQDASRLMLRGQKGEKRDPTRLLREEKMRKRIAKDLPKVEAELRKVLENWEEEYGRPFMVIGERYIDELDAAAAVAGQSRREREPARSKTPAPQPGHTRSNSRAANTAPAKAATVKAPPRSKTPSNFATVRGNPSQTQPSTAQRVTTKSQLPISPSRIPGRAPLTSTHGNKSPDRKYHTMAAKAMGPPPRLPPPKMKDLFVPPINSVTSTPTPMFARSTADLERSASVVRAQVPEDPYSDHMRSGLARSAHIPSSSSHYSLASNGSSIENHPHHDMMGNYEHHKEYRHAPPPASRQISGASTSTTGSSAQSASSAVTGSENWETFEEGSVEPEEHYRLHGQKVGKRIEPEGGWMGDGAGKRVRGAVMMPREGEWVDEDY